jgi:predicted ATP-grasp superfamily ATP-dependent carboligase
MRVLITDISSYKAAVIARYLKLAYPDVHVIATDHRPFVKKIHTKWVKQIIVLDSGPENDIAYVESISSLLNIYTIDFLIPVNSREIRLLMDNRDMLGGALDYVGNSALYSLLDDKIAFGKLLDSENIAAPKSRGTIDASLPLVVKPSRGSSAKGVHYLRTKQDRETFRAVYGSTPEGYVIQDYFEGEGIGYSGFFKDGKILSGYAHRRVAEYPVSGGSSVVRERYPYDDLPQLVDLVKKILVAAPWSGFAMFELKRRGPGDFGFIECNPRIWGSIHQGLSDGAKYFAPLLGPETQNQLPKGKRTALLPLTILSLVGYLSQGRMQPSLAIIESIITAELDINPLTDPLGFLALLRRGV